MTRVPILVACIVGAFLAAAGCRGRASVREPRQTLSPRITALDSRVDVVLGRTLVMPVSLEGAVNPTRPLKARLDDGRAIEAGLYWISVAPQPNHAQAWLPDPGRWSATPASASARPAGVGSWAVVVDLPPDAIGQGLWIGRHRTPLNWLPSPGFLKARDGAIDWSSPLGQLSATPSLAGLAEPEARSPLRRWRHRLMVGGLAPSDDPLVDHEAPADRFSDPVIEAFASQIEGRWQVALATLWMADPYLANTVKRRLANVIDFGNGTIAPAWPATNADLDALLADLLNVRLQPAQQTERARAWLETQPPAAAWVIDDGGQRDAMTGQTVATIGVANLTERDTLGWSAAINPDMVPVPGFSAATVTAVRDGAPERDGGSLSRRRPTRPTSPATDVEVHVGKWPISKSVMLDRVPALPPGVRLEPLRRSWDMTSWLAATPPPPVEDAWAGVGLLYHDATQGAWTMFIECRSPALGGEESIRVWFGAYGAPSSIIRISSAGPVVDEQAPRLQLSSQVNGASVSRQGDTWTVRLPVPERCIEQDGTLRVGLTRTDALNRTTSWPRPMLPWQVEPGRIAIDTSAWAHLGGNLAAPSSAPSSATPASTTR